MSDRLAHGDLEEILGASEGDFKRLRGAHVLVAGGTGFVGTWLVESFLYANRRLALGARVSVLARRPVWAIDKFAYLCDDALAIVAGDVRGFEASFRVDAVINAATMASDSMNRTAPRDMIDTIVAGARSVLDFAARSGDIPVLFTSSGAVYGKQGIAVQRISEDARSGPDILDPRSAYGEAKRLAEVLHAIAARETGLQAKIARLFAFVGPHLPLDRHFAIGNFIRDALAGDVVTLSGDGTAIRSYLYATDMTVWLWAILMRGVSGRAYNVGSEDGFELSAVAELVATSLGRSGVSIASPTAGATTTDRYLPATARIRGELGVHQSVGIEEAIERTMTWHRMKQSPLPIES